MNLEAIGVVSFVAHNATVLAVVPKPQVKLYVSRSTWDDRPFDYEVVLSSHPYLEAIVTATHFNGQTSFKLECITAIPFVARGVAEGPCQRRLDTQAQPAI